MGARVYSALLNLPRRICLMRGRVFDLTFAPWRLTDPSRKIHRLKYSFAKPIPCVQFLDKEESALEDNY